MLRRLGAQGMLSDRDVFSAEASEKGSLWLGVNHFTYSQVEGIGSVDVEAMRAFRLRLFTCTYRPKWISQVTRGLDLFLI